ncbi:DUF4595 domain-containing protein [Alistipes sp.]|uniref:DUF4595 domain-containing protein n=1 Tax=Alistipes sp. TaxID=1872444 RepID=UPI0025B89F71|nr:DUF4595 domain-containing protein [Alistipes sp.]
MKRIFAFLFAAAALAGCSDDSDGGKDIRLSPGTPKKYTIFADETSGTPSEGISFSTTGPWRATVAETRAGSPSWVTVSPDHGDEAGNYTIELNIEVNTTGNNRKATIIIECGSTKIRITIEQRSKTEEGEIPDEGESPGGGELQPVRWLISEVYAYFAGGVEGRRTSLEYDEKGRLIRYHDIISDPNGTGNKLETANTTYVYEYDNNIVRIDCPENKTRLTVMLNDAGYAERMEKTYFSTYESYTTTFKYDSQNHLIRADKQNEWEEYLWENGNLVEVRYGNSEGEKTNTRFTYTGRHNLENLDSQCIVEADMISWDESLIWAGLLGVRSRGFIQSERGDSQWSGKDDFDAEYSFEEDHITKAFKYRLNESGETNRSNPRIFQIKYTNY